MMSPFDYLNSINSNKNDIMDSDEAEKVYNPFLINRSLSYFRDTVLISNEMNKYHHVDNKLQYHFLLNIVRGRKRFSKWIKPEVVDDIDVVKEYYGYSTEKAQSVLPLLSSDQIETIRKKVDKGGRK
jgi:hypothetical protein